MLRTSHLQRLGQATRGLAYLQDEVGPVLCLFNERDLCWLQHILRTTAKSQTRLCLSNEYDLGWLQHACAKGHRHIHNRHTAAHSRVMT